MAMSMEVERGIEGAVFVRGEIAADRRFPPVEGKAGPAREEAPASTRGDDDSASCSSSIGRNTDGSAGSDGDDSGEPEVQSALKGPLDTMDALEDALPIRQGISKFYCGKSRSFTSLADVSSSSCAKDLTKPGNSYTRKRKSLLGFTGNWDGCHSIPMRGSMGGSIPKRPVNSNRTEDHELSKFRPLPYPNGETSALCDTPTQQRYHLSVRSFSLANLQDATPCSSSISSLEKHRRYD